ncbi:hypothetical protein [Desertimonas flava]|uniref:hypothetical protein n=1 Tax=Desertimonas flava TaxID=2064846 RepID=UPI000E349D25|nr:hypothetical protein [Desertimonas flava]
MKKSDVAKLIGIVKGLWPNWTAAPITREQWDDTVSTWMLMLEDVDAASAAAAVQILSAEGREWPPPVGRIRRRSIEAAAHAAGTAPPTPDEAWAEVREAMRDDTTDWSHPAVKEAVDTIGWWDLRHSTNVDTVRAHFVKFYATAADRAWAPMLTPPNARATLDAIALTAAEQRTALPRPAPVPAAELADPGVPVDDGLAIMRRARDEARTREREPRAGDGLVGIGDALGRLTS